jgi:hypothetical protein
VSARRSSRVLNRVLLSMDCLKVVLPLVSADVALGACVIN